MKGDAEYVSPAVDGSTIVENAAANRALPQEVDDLEIVLDLQKVEQMGAGMVHQMNTIFKEKKDDADTNKHMMARSGKGCFHPARAKKN